MIFSPYRKLNLTKGKSELFEALSQNRKRTVRAVERHGWTPVEDRAALAEFFKKNFNQFMQDRNANGTYNLSDVSLAIMLDVESVMLFGVEASGGIVAAVSVFAHTPYAGEYLFNCSTPEGRRYSTPLIWHAVHCLKEMGVPVLNLARIMHVQRPQGQRV